MKRNPPMGIRWLIPLLTKKGEFAGIHSAARFRAIVERERSRSDRNTHGFSMVVFDLGRAADPAEATKRLAEVLRSRVRITDEIGWVNDGDIGVLLPDTTTDGARQFSDHVRCALLPGGVTPECRVYTYPTRDDHGNVSEPDHQLVFEPIMAAAGSSPFGGGRSTGHRQHARDQAPPAAATALPDQVGEPIGAVLGNGIPGWKRGLDIAGAGAALLVLSPLMLLTAGLIKAVSRGPVFFRQERVGYMGRRFTCIKFRTMHVDADRGAHRSYFSRLIHSDAPMRKLDENGDSDPRVIPFGRILRSSAIDELPQLINVLRGEMSLIGPRPCIPYEYASYHRWHRQRVHSVPGLTGLWQVSGKNETTFTEMMRMDIAYGRRRSLRRDLAIFARTLPVLAAQIRGSLSARMARHLGARKADLA